MKHLKKLNELVSQQPETQSVEKTELSIPDVAWLYLLSRYDKGMEEKSWKNDGRMFDVKFIDSMHRALAHGYVSLTNGLWKITHDGIQHVKKVFYKPTFKEALDSRSEFYQFEKLDKPYPIDKGKFVRRVIGYPISLIPKEIWLEYHPDVSDGFDELSDLFTDWWNHYGERKGTSAMNKMIKHPVIKYWNLAKAATEFEKIPATLELYRGIKNEYNEELNKKGFSSWSFEKEQGERFAKYHFSRFEPSYANTQILLSTSIDFDKILVFIGGEESEVVLKNPVKNIKMTRLNYNKENDPVMLKRDGKI